MNFEVNEENIRRNMEFHGVISIKSFSHGENNVFVVHLLPLPLVLQNLITIIAGLKGFKISSGIIFNSKDVDEAVISKAEEIMRNLVEKEGLVLRKNEGVYWLELESNDARIFEVALKKMAESVKELNFLFSGNEQVREECLRKKYSYIFP